MSRNRSRSTHEYKPRNRTPKTAKRAKMVVEVRTHVSESTDPRGVGAAKLQRYDDGSLRLLLTEQMGRAATHGYAIALATNYCGSADMILTTTGKERYTIPAADYDAAALCNAAA
jgi:hypothetical protein